MLQITFISNKILEVYLNGGLEMFIISLIFLQYAFPRTIRGQFVQGLGHNEILVLLGDYAKL